jgi:type II secretory ATPase GspE/PulE/Tfp pilus assembly ATPase PilB-like protein/DNA-binding response OmpR family regulator
MESRTKSRILCVDDDKVTLRAIERSLIVNGYSVLTAENGERALQTLQSVRPDLILLDAMMPGMDGYEVCSRLRQNEEFNSIPVIFVTSLEQKEDKVKAFALGAADYLNKPIQKEMLLSKVATCLETHARWEELGEAVATKPSVTTPIEASVEIAPRSVGLRADFLQFKVFLTKQPTIPQGKRERLLALSPRDLYSLSSELGVSDEQIAKWIAEFLQLPYLPQVGPEKVALGVLPPPFCKTNLVLPLTDNNGRAFALSNPFNWELLRLLKKYEDPSQSLKFYVTEPRSILALFKGGATQRDTPAPHVSISEIEMKLRERYQPAEDTSATALDGANEESEPLIVLVNQIIENAYSMGASDIHIEPWENEIVVRYRVDGVLRIVNRFTPRTLIRPFVARIKVMSDLDISERRLPQDGRIIFKKYTNRGFDFDLRIATAPMNHGEKIVMRILDKQKAVMPLINLGLSARHMKLYREKIETPYGMILHVGPTGSGKSMTLYAALNEVQSPEVNIQTIEDPIEYTLAGLNQLQVHRDIGLTFARALRSYLRQDPDIILVGEIRDKETAEISIEAALTGHLLLSTLHTNDAPSTITRFIEMGIEPFMVSSSIVLICAQRLLRRLCKNCKELYRPNDDEKHLLGVDLDSPIEIYRSKGCEACNNTGYKGRIGIHEILVPDDAIRKAINEHGITSETLKRMAIENTDMTTLYWDAMEKVRQGITSIEDALGNVRRDEFDSRPQWMFDELGIKRPQHHKRSAA